MTDWLQSIMWGERAETKVTEDREHYKKLFINATSPMMWR
jgi:hypothetical protein